MVAQKLNAEDQKATHKLVSKQARPPLRFILCSMFSYILQNMCSQVLTTLRVGWAQWKVWNPGKFLRTYSTGVNVNRGFVDPELTKESPRNCIGVGW